MSAAIDVDSLHINHGKTSVLWDISLSVPRGQLVGILGPNGAGKSTLLKAALGLIKPFSGKVDLLGHPVAFVRNKIAYIPQRESIDWDFPITAEELVLMGRYGRLGLFRRIRKADREAVTEALERVGMGAYAHRQIGQLSGGQQQRLFIARALVQGADLFLFDELFAGVDIATEKSIMALLKTQKEGGKSIFIIHHDLSTVEEYFDWVILLNTRLIASGPTSQVFTEENLAAAFGKGQALFDEAAAMTAQSLSGML